MSLSIDVLWEPVVRSVARAVRETHLLHAKLWCDARADSFSGAGFSFLATPPVWTVTRGLLHNVDHVPSREGALAISASNGASAVASRLTRDLKV